MTRALRAAGIEACAPIAHSFVPAPGLSLCFSSNLALLSIFIFVVHPFPSFEPTFLLSFIPPSFLLLLFVRPSVSVLFRSAAISTWKCPPWGHVGHEGTYTTYFEGRRNNVSPLVGPVIGRLRERAASSLYAGPDFRYGPIPAGETR